jgi:hypothetical protein
MTLTTKIVSFVVVAALAAVPAQADAFWGHHRRVTTAYSVPTVPVVVARPVVAAPIVVGYAPAAMAYPVTTAAYVAPTMTYYAPTTTYYAPTTAYFAPRTTYYAPAPTTTYYAPSVAAPVVSAPVTTYYAPSPIVAPAIYVP